MLFAEKSVEITDAGLLDGDGISNADEIRYGLNILVYTAIGDIEWQLCVDE